MSMLQVKATFHFLQKIILLVKHRLLVTL